MSLIINKFEPGGKTTLPRLYKRGNDDIDLDAYIRNAESEFEFWLANSRLKNKEKLLVRDAYTQMLQGISEGKVTYKIGGGYDNLIGMSNSPEGFDAAGLAAGFLGNILRKLNVYLAPEEELDPTKTKYEGTKSIGNKALKYLLGDAGNILYFINLDQLVNGKRGHTERIKQVQNFINDLATEGNWDKYFTGYSLDLKDEWFKNYELYGKNIDVNGNGLLDDSEYLGLSKLLGLNNIELLFFTGKTYSSTAQSPTNNPIYTDEQLYLDAVHPRTSLELPSYSLSSNKTYSKIGHDRLINILWNIPKGHLLKMVELGLSLKPDGKELNQVDYILKGFDKRLTSFLNSYILSQILEILRQRGYIKPFLDNSNLYHVPSTLNSNGWENLGLAYKIDPSGNHLLLVMDRRDIPYFLELWHNDFISQVPSNRQGGILKAQNGTNTKKLIGNIGHTSNYNFYQHGISNWIDDLLTLATKAEDKAAFAKLINDTLSAHSKLYQKWDQSNAYLGDDNDVKAYQQGIIDNFGYVNTKGISSIKANNYYTYPNNPQTTDNSKSNWAPDNYYAAQTDDRRVLGRKGDFGSELEREYWLKFKLAGYDFYLDPVDGYYKLNVIPDEDIPSTINTGIEEPDEPYDGSDFNEVTGESEKLKTVEETQLPKVEESIKANSWKNYIPDLISAGRLWASLRTNNRVYNTVLPSLKPVLKDTYERYSPVTGDFGMRLFKNRQASNVLLQAYKPFTSDASLAAARMLEGQISANRLQNEGFLADDLEIRKTKDAALNRLEENMARRSGVANFNRESINLTNREKALLEATRLKSNWLSWDNFLSGIESRTRDRVDENRILSNYFREQIATRYANQWATLQMELANKELQLWIKDNTVNGVFPDVTNWSKWNAYQERLMEVANMAKALEYKDVLPMYNIIYGSPYTDESYKHYKTWV